MGDRNVVCLSTVSLKVRSCMQSWKPAFWAWFLFMWKSVFLVAERRRYLKLSSMQVKVKYCSFPSLAKGMATSFAVRWTKIGKKKNQAKKFLLEVFHFLWLTLGTFLRDRCAGVFLHSAFEEKHTRKLVFSATYLRIHWCNYILASLFQNSSKIYSYTTHLTFLCFFCYGIPLLSNCIDQKA